MLKIIFQPKQQQVQPRRHQQVQRKQQQQALRLRQLQHLPPASLSR